MSFLALADNLNRLHGVQYFRMTIRLRMVIPDYQTRVGIGRVRIRDFFIFRTIVSRAAPVFRRNRPEAGADSQKIKNPGYLARLGVDVFFGAYHSWGSDFKNTIQEDDLLWSPSCFR